MESTTRTSLFSEPNTKLNLFSRETPLQKDEINTNYLLAGAGAVIFMLLFMIVIEIMRKPKSPKRKSLLLPERNENQTCVETFKQPPNASSKEYLNITSSKQSNHFYKHMDPVYHEIDESMELMQNPASTDLSTVFGDRNLAKFINNLTRNVPKTMTQTSETHV